MKKRKKSVLQPAVEVEATQFFYALTPEKILDAVELLGLSCTGRVLPLNSMENRVYEVEIEVDGEIQSPSDRFRVAKFYRPGRWSREQILEEHEFLLDLQRADIPVIAPLISPEGETLYEIPDLNIFAAIFPKVGGRLMDELDEERALRLGRLIARMHLVGATKDAPHRMELSGANFAILPSKILEASPIVPLELKETVRLLGEQLCDLADTCLGTMPFQRVHGDCHSGNMVWRDDSPFILDFDDMLRGPCVQDLWLFAPGRDSYSLEMRELMVQGYEELRSFDRRALRTVEVLRALRMFHFLGWIAKRWEDPAFPRVFPSFDSPGHWHEELVSIREQLALAREELLA